MPDSRDGQSERPVKVEISLNRLGYWRADAYRDGECIATYGAAGSVAEALRRIADNPALKEAKS